MILRKNKNLGMVTISALTMCSLLLSGCAQTVSENTHAIIETEQSAGTNTSDTNPYNHMENNEKSEVSTETSFDITETSKADETELVSEKSTEIAETAISEIASETETTLETLIDEEVPTAIMRTDGLRDNTPICYTPVAAGTVVYANALAAIDASNASQGYIMVNYKGVNPKVKLQITGSNGVTYTYNLHGGYETFPLSAGSGAYKVAVYENVTGNQYATALSQTVTANITNPFGPYLYPNQYVNFNAASLVVSKAMQLAEGSVSDLDVVTKVYNYTTSIVYDHNKAATVQSGYTPNVDVILQSGTGICLDYAAVMASMLRSQNIPTRLEVGYAGNAYHAWISTYITDIGWVNGIIQFDGVSWSLMDPTFAANTSNSALKSFIGDGSNYKTKYIY